MAKKKKKAKKGKKTGDGSGGAAKSGQSKEKSFEEQRRVNLIKRAKQMQRKIDQETTDFDQFQQQRDQLNYFWIVEKKNLEDKKSERRHKDRELQDMEEKHQVDIKLYKQSVKHLLYEHQNEVTTQKTDQETSLKFMEDSHRGSEAELKLDRRGMKLQLKEMDLAHDAYLRSLMKANDEEISTLRHQFERKAKELQLKYDKKYKEVRSALESHRKLETQRIEDRKNAHIGRLMKEHEKAFSDIKSYYHDITHNNLDLIKSLKEGVSEMKKKERQDEKKMMQITQENKRMYEPLKIALADVDRLRKELQAYEKDKQELMVTKSRLLVLEEQLKTLQWEQEVLEQRFVGVQKERDELYGEFQKAIFAVKQKSGFKNLLIEKKLGAMHEELEKRDAQLSELLSHANVESSEASKQAMGAAAQDLSREGVNPQSWDDVVEVKNQGVRDLQQKLGELIEQHNGTIQHYERKLLEYGIPVEELGFMPQLLTMPAALRAQ